MLNIINDCVRVINQAASDVGQSFDALPEHLMMDEFKSVKNVTGK